VKSDHNITHIIIMKYLALALMLVAAASAHEAEEGRTLFTSSSGNMYLGLNDSTLLIGVIGLALAGGLLFVALQTFGADAFLPAQSSAYDRYSTHPDLAYANSAAANAALAYAQNQHEQHQQYRRKRSPFTYNLATKLTQLEKAFKKFEVETEECQMFVACEAAQYKKLAQNVPVVQIVSQILSAPGDDTKVSPNVLKAFRNGLAAHQHDVAEACEPLRQVCYAAHNQ